MLISPLEVEPVASNKEKDAVTKTKVLLKGQKCQRNEQEKREWGQIEMNNVGVHTLNISSTKARAGLRCVRRSNLCA